MLTAERFERLRTIGDGVLYGCGFFRDHFEARGVDAKYLHGLGTRAYGAASSMLRHGADGASVPSPGRGPYRRRTSSDLFAELADKFDAFVDVLEGVSDTTIAMFFASPLGFTWVRNIPTMRPSLSRTIAGSSKSTMLAGS